ncbi:MAG: phytanoyl-CoA dioxygenase family protein [Chloroflexota bacterium]|nr:phytanoyl-CoA dioxygenase family protein [Chloroflexota bacterium]
MVQTTQPVLTESQRRAAEEDGYFVVEGLVSPAACQRFIQRLDDYAHTRRPVPAGLAIQREPRVARGTLQAAPGEDVRKISGVARGDDLFGALVVQPEIVRIIQELTSPNVKLFRADVLMKPAGVGSAKGMHQDSPYWPIEPMALWSCWLPFDPSLLENGCMTAIPGSHKRGPLPHVRVTDDYIIPDKHYEPDDVVAIPMEPGSGLFFHSLLLHGTAENRSALPRRAITMSYMATESRYTGQSPQPEYLRISGLDVPGGV